MVFDYRFTASPKNSAFTKQEPARLPPDVLTGLIGAAEKMQHTFDECPELKDLYAKQYEQVLETIKRNFEKDLDKKA